MSKCSTTARSTTWHWCVCRHEQPVKRVVQNEGSARAQAEIFSWQKAKNLRAWNATNCMSSLCLCLACRMEEREETLLGVSIKGTLAGNLCQQKRLKMVRSFPFMFFQFSGFPSSSLSCFLFQSWETWITTVTHWFHHKYHHNMLNPLKQPSCLAITLIQVKRPLANLLPGQVSGHHQQSVADYIAHCPCSKCQHT